MNELQEIALYWLEQGIATIPIQYHHKEPDSRALIRAGYSEKRPDGTVRGTWQPFQTQLPSEWEISCMFASRLVNIGLVTGWQNLVVIDFDDWLTFLKWYPKGLETYMVETSRGVHVYFFSEQPAAARKGLGVDIKANGGYVLIPPSIHPSGKEYKIIWPTKIARVRSIDDLLSPEWFPEEEPQQPAAATVQAAPTVVPNQDPWAAAMNAGFAPGQDLIFTIRQRVSILDYVQGAESSSGDGRWYIAKCPFHQDQHPSFWVDTHRQICGCYACGGKPMDVINLVARLMGLTNRDAIFLLAKVL